MTMNRRRMTGIRTLIILAVCVCAGGPAFAQKEKINEPIIVNGDTVEYSTDNKEITASGKVMVMYRGTKLTCNKLTVNTQTKDAKAEGDVRIEDEKGLMEGREITYNFDKKTGNITDASFRYPPYFGKAKTIQRVSEEEFIIIDGYATTCDLGHPHYRIRSKKIKFFPGNKIQTKGNLFYVDGAPMMYLPWFNYSLKKPFAHVQVLPGKSSEWGEYLLTAWRYDLSDNVKAKVYTDYRTKLGLANGVGLNYASANFGKGDLKFYYTNETPKDAEEPGEFQRYLLRARHNWEISPRTRAVMEYYKIGDEKRKLGAENNFLKDYFYREYEKDAQPKSYFLMSHAFNYSSISLLAQQQTNHWYTHTDLVPDEKLPEVTYSLPEYKLGESPVYFQNMTSIASLANKNVLPSGLSQDVHRFDTYNQLSLPFRASIFSLRPFAGSRETYYSRDVNGDSLGPRTVFYSGMDMSTKLYRIYDVNSNFLGLDINGLRHIVTPLIGYAYNHTPTIPSSKLQAFDQIDTISSSNKVTLELVNKLQTKRLNSDKSSGPSVDLAMFKVNTDYTFSPKGDSTAGFSDFLFDLELAPYSWLRVTSDVIYGRKEGYFKQVNTDWYADLGEEKSFGVGFRYDRSGGKELTSEYRCRLSPKWKFRIYERYQFAEIAEKGFKEQEYSLTRDLHCWEMDFTYNIKKDSGHTVWVAFRLKAFPETEFKFDQSYHTTKSGPEQTPVH